MEHRELQLLMDYTGGAQAVNTWVRPTPRAVGGELEKDERAEVVYMEIVAPVVGVVEEELLKIIPVLDGREWGDYVSLSGIRATNMAPLKSHIFQGKLYSFGKPMSNNPLLSTTLKYSESISIEALCGAAIAITVPWRVRMWGYKYKTSELAAAFGTMIFPAPVNDPVRDRSFVIYKDPIVVSGDTWKTLPGGKDQGVPKINPLIRYAYNVNATNGLGGDYEFRYDIGNVLDADENMLFNFDEKDALIIKGLGVKAGANMALASLKIDGNYHPKGLIPVTVGNNPQLFGFGFPEWINTLPIYYAIPRFEIPYLIWNEIGTVVARDDTTAACATRSIIMALTGTRIEMKGG